jgi:hypothetical protein
LLLKKIIHSTIFLAFDGLLSLLLSSSSDFFEHSTFLFSVGRWISSRGGEQHLYLHAYSDATLADEEWLAEYNREREEREERMVEFRRRLDGSEPINSW